MVYHLAIDFTLHGTSFLLGGVQDGRILAEEICAFPHTPAQQKNGLCSDLPFFLAQLIAGLQRCAQLGKAPVSMGITAFQGEYVLLDEADAIVAHSLAQQTDLEQAAALATQRVPAHALYFTTGVQSADALLYHLLHLRQTQPQTLSQAHHLLPLADALHFLLCGQKSFEYTAAATTGLVEIAHKTWDLNLLYALQLPQTLFGTAPTLPGTVLGTLHPDLARQVGFSCKIVLPATHRTACACLAAPLHLAGAAALLPGATDDTLLLCTELSAPSLSEENRRAGFSCYGGYDGRFFYAKPMGIVPSDTQPEKLAFFCETCAQALQHISAATGSPCQDFFVCLPDTSDSAPLVACLQKALSAAVRPLSSLCPAIGCLGALIGASGELPDIAALRKQLASVCVLPGATPVAERYL